MKVGDGIHTFAQLNWAQAVAADVYDWAKAPAAPTAAEISAQTLDAVPQTSTIQAVLSALNDKINTISGLSGALHFKGITTTEITDGGTEPPTINGNVIPLTELKAGDVVLYNKVITDDTGANANLIDQEFIWTADGTSGKWELFGDETRTSSAVSGSAYDLNEVNTSTSPASDGYKFFILDCGDASHFIDNASP